MESRQYTSVQAVPQEDVLEEQLKPVVQISVRQLFASTSPPGQCQTQVVYPYVWSLWDSSELRSSAHATVAQAHTTNDAIASTGAAILDSLIRHLRSRLELRCSSAFSIYIYIYISALSRL